MPLPAVPEVADDRLEGRAVFAWADGGPETALDLDPEAAVWVVRLAGSLVGRVGDLDLGLTKRSGETLADAGFFPVAFLPAFGVVDGRDLVSAGLLADLGCDTGMDDLTGRVLAAFWAVPAVGFVIFVAFVLSTPFTGLITAAPPLVPRLALALASVGPLSTPSGPVPASP